MKRLARRLRAREEGAARRFEAASSRLSVAVPEIRRELELALRRAQDDKRGAAIFRAAVLDAAEACADGPGCGESPLSEHWEAGCPPEQPDLGREVRAVAVLSRVLARKMASCAAAACPQIDCGTNARIAGLLSVAQHDLKVLENPPVAKPGSVGTEQKAIRDLLKECEEWRGRIAALFLGGPEPAAQIMATAKAARLLASRLSEARAPGTESRIAPMADPYWRLQVLSIRLERVASALVELASAVGSDAPDRDAVLLKARRKAAEVFRDLLITQMRIRSARERAEAIAAGAGTVGRCARRRRNEIARARGQIRVMRAALARCAGRAACAKRSKPVRGKLSGFGLDPVSARRLRLDRTFGKLKQLAPVLKIKTQGPVEIATALSRYESGEAVPVRINSRAAACMADDGSWVGLFQYEAPRLRGSEAGGVAIRRLNLRGRPWEEVFFEAPSEPGNYEVRTYAAEGRGGAITGRARFEVTPREEGCRGFSGVWRTNFGRLQITVRDGRARGSYKRSGEWRSGFLTGKVKGRVLFGEWQSDLGGGGTRLVLSKDGNSLSGTWSHFRDEFAGTGVWNGKCAGPVRRQDQTRNRKR